MSKKILIITTAHLNESECLRQGYSFQERIDEYKESFSKCLLYKDIIDEFYILETRSKDKLDYLEESGFMVHYSNLPNLFINKGMNEIYHFNNFVQTLKLSDYDLIYKLSGRYKIQNSYFFEDSNYYCVAKDDRDMYPHPPHGVHTFYYLINNLYLKKFYDFIGLEYDNPFYKHNVCLEHELKRFMESSPNCKVISKDEKIGVITCVWDGSQWEKKYV